MSGFHFMIKKLQFFAVVQKFNLIAARVTFAQLRWNFANLIF